MERLESTEMGLVAATPEHVTVNVTQVHHRFGHMSEAATQLCAKELDWTIQKGLLTQSQWAKRPT